MHQRHEKLRTLAEKLYHEQCEEDGLKADPWYTLTEEHRTLWMLEAAGRHQNQGGFGYDMLSGNTGACLACEDGIA